MRDSKFSLTGFCSKTVRLELIKTLFKDRDKCVSSTCFHLAIEKVPEDCGQDSLKIFTLFAQRELLRLLNKRRLQKSLTS